jgi:hypothetical protein
VVIPAVEHVAAVEDDFQEGVESVIVNYSKNGVAQAQ